jgi:hypothetical protein
VGAMGAGSAAVGGGGPPACRVGGRPPAGHVPEGNSAAGSGNPSTNAVSTITVPSAIQHQD